MKRIKRRVARRAAKAAVTHTAHGVASKARRRPLRSTTLLGVGALAGWLAGRRRG